METDNILVALAGNPNTGKSTIFNSLTGLNQHTGNWTGKTVSTARGKYRFQNRNFLLVDLPGTYSLFSNSEDEEIARDFILFGHPQVTIVVADATSLERNLILLFQILEITDKVVLCINLMDEAKRKKIQIDLNKLSELLGIPVVGTNAKKKEGLEELKEAVKNIALQQIDTNPLKIKYNSEIEEFIGVIENKIKSFTGEKINSRWVSLKILEGDNSVINSVNKHLNLEITKLLTDINIDEKKENWQEQIASGIVKLAENISHQVVKINNPRYNHLEKRIDDILTSKIWGIPTMLILLSLIFWITIEGANIPSQVIANILFGLEEKISNIFVNYNLPQGLHDPLVNGVYKTLAWVVSVMLPPMAIFFPLFTLMEDLGYLPRIAFNLDNFFKKACAHGKQALTMCMGFGCNAAGVIGCRIIDSPREKLIAILTNVFVPCNGRFPILITLTTIFFVGTSNKTTSTITAALMVTAIIVLGVTVTLFISKLLSKTILKGMPSSFTLELPPYRMPQIGKIIVRSILDRTLFVLGRAIIVAAPAGLVIWLMANTKLKGATLLENCANLLDPFARLLGMDGYILQAFLLGLPANEIVLPIIIMSYLASNTMLELESLETLRNLLVTNGWTWLTALNVMLFSLMHFPCGTTLLTIRKETQSWKWTFLAFLIPTTVGITVTFLLTQFVRFLGLV